MFSLEGEEGSAEVFCLEGDAEATAAGFIAVGEREPFTEKREGEDTEEGEVVEEEEAAVNTLKRAARDDTFPGETVLRASAEP